MPYIKQRERERLEPLIEPLVTFLCQRPLASVCGLINYTVTRILIGVWCNCRTYPMANNLLGCLECVKLEFYRRALAPYEDAKIADNGDVYLS